MNQQLYEAQQLHQQYSMVDFRVGIDDYEILQKLGQGSYGMVYKGRKKSDGKIYVIKEINMKFMDQKQRQDAINEGNFLKHLQSPFVVKYYDMFVERDDLYIVMEYCENGDLLQYIKKQKNQLINENKIWIFFLQMLLGLHSIHQHKILHRDFKTMNMFLTKNSTEIRIGDLGVAKYLGETNNLAKTMVGTPYYLSPEICEEKPYNDKSDVWSIGCILYELCTFKHPFEANNQGALIIKILKNKVEPLPSIYSREMQIIVNLLLTKDYLKRPDTTALLSHPKSKETITQLNKERLSKSPNARIKFQQLQSQQQNNSINNDKMIKVGSINNIETSKPEKVFKKNLNLQSTLPSNVDKGYINEIFQKNVPEKKIILTRNKSEKQETTNTNEGSMISPNGPGRAFQFSQRNQENEQESIENSKQSSLQNLQFPKNFAKEQQSKLESIIQNQRNIFFQPIMNSKNNHNNGGLAKKTTKKTDSTLIYNKSSKNINLKDKFINEQSHSPQIAGAELIGNQYMMSINDYVDLAFLQNQQKSIVFNDHIIMNSKQLQNNSQLNNNDSPQLQDAKQYYSPKIKTMRQSSIDPPLLTEKIVSATPNITIKQLSQKNFNQNLFQSQSSKNIVLPSPSPSNMKGKRNFSNVVNTSNDKSIQSPSKEQMKQINIFNQINYIGSQNSSNNLKEMGRLADSQTYFNSNSNYTTKLPDIQSNAILSTRPKSNVANVMDVFQQRNKQSISIVSQQQQQQSPNQFQVQQQYSSRKNSKGGNPSQNSNLNPNIISNASCIQLANNNSQTNGQLKNSQCIEESKKSSSIVRGDHKIQQQVSQQIASKLIEAKTNENKNNSQSPHPSNLRKTLKNLEQENNSMINKKQIQESLKFKKHHRNNTHSENYKKNNKSFQFDDRVEVSTYAPTASIKEQSQRGIKDIDQLTQFQHNSNPTRYSKNSMIETTLESQNSIKELNQDTSELQQKNYEYNTNIINKKLLSTKTTTKSSQNSTQIGIDDKQLNKGFNDAKKQEGPGINQYNQNQINDTILKDENDYLNENVSSILFSEKRNLSGLSQMLNQNGMKKTNQTPILPQIKQQIPLSRNFYQGNIHLSANQSMNSNLKSEQYSSPQAHSRQNNSNGNFTYFSQLSNQRNQQQVNIFRTKDIQELDQLFELESNKLSIGQQNSNQQDQVYNLNLEIQNPQINYQENHSNKQRGSASYLKRIEFLENNITDLQTQISSRQKFLNLQIGIVQFSDLYSTLKQKIKNISDLEQCNMKEIDQIINNCIKNCTSKTMSNIYSLLKLQIKLDRAQAEYDNLKRGKNY